MHDFHNDWELVLIQWILISLEAILEIVLIHPTDEKSTILNIATIRSGPTKQVGIHSTKTSI